MSGSLTVNPGYEVLDPLLQIFALQHAIVPSGVDEVVVGRVEQQVSPGDDAFEDADGVDDGGDGDPGDLAVLAGGDVVAVVVGDVSATGPQSLYYRAPMPVLSRFSETDRSEAHLLSQGAGRQPSPASARGGRGRTFPKGTKQAR